MNKLTLAEKKYLVRPYINGYKLFGATITELLIYGILTIKPVGDSKNKIHIHDFIRLNYRNNLSNKNLVYRPISEIFNSLNQVKFGWFLKNSFSYFKNDFNIYKEKNVEKNLRQKHAYIPSFFSNLFSNKTLTRKGEKAKNDLQEELDVLSKIIASNDNDWIDKLQLRKNWEINIQLLDSAQLQKVKMHF